MKVWLNVPFDVLVTNLTNATVHVTKHIVLFSSGDSMVIITDPEQVGKERHHTVVTVQITPEPLVQEM